MYLFVQCDSCDYPHYRSTQDMHEAIEYMGGLYEDYAECQKCGQDLTYKIPEMIPQKDLKGHDFYGLLDTDQDVLGSINNTPVKTEIIQKPSESQLKQYRSILTSHFRKLQNDITDHNESVQQNAGTSVLKNSVDHKHSPSYSFKDLFGFIMDDKYNGKHSRHDNTQDVFIQPSSKLASTSRK